MDMLVTRTAASLLASTLGRPVGAHIVDAVAGTPEQRALDKACQAAMERAVNDATGSGVTNEEVDHVLTLVGQMVEARDIDALPVLEPRDLAGAVESWRGTADGTGLHPPSFPVAFDLLVENLLRYLPEEFHRRAAEPGSPLFGRVVLANLERLSSELAAVAQRLTEPGVAAQVPLSSDLGVRLDTVRTTCRVIGRPVYTADVLLLIIQTAVVARCFDSVRLGLSADLKRQLEGYAADLADGVYGEHPYVEFEWFERDEVRRAQHVALRVGIPTVTDLALLCGILEAPSSNTRADLAALLDTDFQRLADAAASALTARGLPPTPGRVFGST